MKIKSIVALLAISLFTLSGCGEETSTEGSDVNTGGVIDTGTDNVMDEGNMGDDSSDMTGDENTVIVE